MQRAIFFDRDGVLNREIGDYVCKIEDFEILPDSVECIKMVKDMGFMAIVVTNQGGIDKDLYTAEELAGFHQKLQNACLDAGTSIDDFYFCPHHPIKGKCLCRKPDSLMIEKALAKYRLDPGQCLIIGDTERDINAGLKAGIHTLQIQPNSEKKRLLEEAIDKMLAGATKESVG